MRREIFVLYAVHVVIVVLDYFSGVIFERK